MASDRLVRVVGGWLKWDKDHYKWENVEESSADKGIVLKRATSSAAIPTVPEPSPLLKKRAKPLAPTKNARNGVSSKKLPAAKNKLILKRHSLPSSTKENVVPRSAAPKRAAPTPVNKSRDGKKLLDKAKWSSPSHLQHWANQQLPQWANHQRCDQSEKIPTETPSISAAPTNRSIASAEERVSHDHATMMTILSSRLLRLRAAASLWRQCGVRPVVSYLLKINVDGVTADVLPVLVKSLHFGLSVEICCDLQPLLRQLLLGKYEDYIVKVLSFLDVILHYCDDDQREGHPLTSCLQALVHGLSESVEHVAQQGGIIHTKAKKLDDFMKLLVTKYCSKT